MGGGAPECCICMESGDRSGGGWAALPECGHVMHLPCLAQCLEHKPVCPVCREPHYGGPGELLQVYFETAAEPEEEGRVKVEGEGGPCAHTGAAAEVERLRGELMLAQAARAAALRREEQARQSQEAFRADTLQEAERLRERGTAEAVELRHQLDLANSALEKEKRDVQAKEAEVLSLKRLYAAFSSNKELDVSVWRASMQGYSEKAANEVLLNAVAKRDKDYRQLTRKFGEIQGKMEAAVARARAEGERDAKARAAELGRQVAGLRKQNRSLEEMAAERRLGAGLGLAAAPGGGAGLQTTIPLGRVIGGGGGRGAGAGAAKRQRLSAGGAEGARGGRAEARPPSFIEGSQAGRLEDVSNSGSFIIEGPDGKGGRARFLRRGRDGGAPRPARAGGEAPAGAGAGGGEGGGGGRPFRPAPGALERFLSAPGPRGPPR